MCFTLILCLPKRSNNIDNYTWLGVLWFLLLEWKKLSILFYLNFLLSLSFWSICFLIRDQCPNITLTIYNLLWHQHIISCFILIKKQVFPTLIYLPLFPNCKIGFNTFHGLEKICTLFIIDQLWYVTEYIKKKLCFVALFVEDPSNLISIMRQNLCYFDPPLCKIPTQYNKCFSYHFLVYYISIFQIIYLGSGGEGGGNFFMVV